MADLRALPGLKPTSFEAPCPVCGDTLLLGEDQRLYYGCATGCTMEAIVAKIAELKTATKALSPVWLEDFLLEDIPPPRWLLAPYIQAETVCVLFSAPNVGKTLLAFHVMCQLAMQGKVLALEAEGSRGAFQKRLGRAAAAVGGVPSRRFATFHSTALSILEPRHEAAISAWATGYDCTMIDSLGMFTAGVDENDPVGMGLVGGALRRIRQASGGSVFGLHHGVKASWLPGQAPSLANLRGHSALAGMVDTALALVPAPEQPDGCVAFDLWVVKQRDEERVKPRRYTVDMRGDAATMGVIEIDKFAAKNEADAKLSIDVLEYIKAAGDNGVSGNAIELNVAGNAARIREARRSLHVAKAIEEVRCGRYTKWRFVRFVQARLDEPRHLVPASTVLRTGGRDEPEETQ